MKKAFSVVFLLLAVVPAWGQSLEEIGRELGRTVVVSLVGRSLADRDRAQVKRATARYNSPQPTFPFRGTSLEIVLEEDQWSSYYYQLGQSWLSYGLRHILTNLGSRVVWNVEGIREESGEREYLETNRWVNPSARHPEATIEVARYRAEITALISERREDLGIEFSRFFRNGFDLQIGRQMAFAGLVLSLRNKRTGEIVAAYKVVGTAQETDRAGADFFAGLFGGHFGGRYNAQSGSSLHFKAMENALRELEGALWSKNRAQEYRR